MMIPPPFSYTWPTILTGLVKQQEMCLRWCWIAWWLFQFASSESSLSQKWTLRENRQTNNVTLLVLTSFLTANKGNNCDSVSCKGQFHWHNDIFGKSVHCQYSRGWECGLVKCVRSDSIIIPHREWISSCIQVNRHSWSWKVASVERKSKRLISNHGIWILYWVVRKEQVSVPPEENVAVAPSVVSSLTLLKQDAVVVTDQEIIAHDDVISIAVALASNWCPTQETVEPLMMLLLSFKKLLVF
jgi:hypothetical protein